MYEMTIDYNVLNHLGINLYSNTPAVLSEVVANSWDADATEVHIEIKKGIITIKDNGHGMTLDDINNKYLKVGYERREPGKKSVTKRGRNVMGRKGIGKLSLFSIANIVKVESFKEKQSEGFVMSVKEINDHIEKQKKQILPSTETYKPSSMQKFEMKLKNDGTRIILTQLKRQITKAHPDHLRKRIARRFSIMGTDDFNVYINNSLVNITDRDYFHKLQYLWHYGNKSEKYIGLCSNLESSEHVQKTDGIIEPKNEDNTEHEPYSVSGWIGTVRKPSELTDTETKENLNKIVIMVRGKLAQEDILEDFRQAGVYSKYLIGEIHADFLDLDKLDDIATTNRQAIVKEDPRYEKLKDWMEKELNKIREMWSDWRSIEAFNEALEIPAITEWFEN